VKNFPKTLAGLPRTRTSPFLQYGGERSAGGIRIHFTEGTPHGGWTADVIHAKRPYEVVSISSESELDFRALGAMVLAYLRA
jgi:hypothetical protein